MPSTELEQNAAPAELGIGEALVLAVKLHRAGYLEDAERLYGRILEADPQQPDALSFLGMISLHRGRVQESIALIQRSIAIDPRADRYNNLGNVLLAAERVNEGVAAYRKAIELEPRHADAHNNLGIVYRAQRRYDESAAAYKTAIDIDPKHVEAYTNYGNLMSAQGSVREAITAYSHALTLRPHDDEARKYLALAYAALGDLEAAAAIYRKWLESEPDHPGVKHLLAACCGVDVPERAADAYIESTFDSFSQTFDAKLAQLEYRAPRLVADALAAAAPAASGRLRALDAGCGTGLCAPLIAPYVSTLHGVDLSAGMLEKARIRGLYATLEKAELTQYLSESPDAFDLVVSADTLVYFGVLDAALSGAHRVLRQGGLLIFTVEEAPPEHAPEGHRLNPHGRYSHTQDYVERALAAAGFARWTIGRDVLRQERGEPVPGLIVTAHKAGTPRTEALADAGRTA